MIQCVQCGKREKSSLQYKFEPDCEYFPFSDTEIPVRRIKFAEELSCHTLGPMILKMLPCDKPVF